MQLFSALKSMAHSFVRPLPDSLVIQLLFLRKFGRLPDFKNPKTFNEKINWRKLYQRDPRFIVFADKIDAKTEVSGLIGETHIVPTLWSGDDPSSIPYDSLTPPFVIKTSNGCGGHLFIRKKEDLNKEKAEAFLRKQLGSVYGTQHREWAYQRIKPRILVERMLEMPDGTIPNDVKLFVYHGKVHFFQIDTSRFGKHKMAFLDRDWNKLPFTKGHPQIDEALPKPQHYALLIELAEKIGALFDFARVDFYDLPSGVYFGEVTFYPAGGFGRFYPEEWDENFGSPWQITTN